MTTKYDWLRRFDMPIDLPDGGKIETLHDAARWLTQAASHHEHQPKDLQSAINFVHDAAEGHGSMLLAELSMIQVVNSPMARQLPRSNGDKPVQRRRPRAVATSAAPAKARRAATSQSADTALKKVPHWFHSLGFAKLAADQRLLWRKRLLAMTARPAEQSPVQVDNPTVIDLLTRMRASGGAIYWKEDIEPTFDGLDEAMGLGYVVRLSGANHEGIALTRKGRRVLGLGQAPSLLERTTKRLGYPIKPPHFSSVAMRRKFLSSLTMEKAPELSRFAAVFEPYRQAGHLFLRRYRTLRGWKIRGK